MDLHYFELYANMQTSIFALTNIIKLTYIKSKQKAEGGLLYKRILKSGGLLNNAAPERSKQ